MVPGQFFTVFHSSRLAVIAFHGSRLVFHGSRWVFMAFHGSRLVHMVPGWFFMVTGWFLWFLVCFSWFFSKIYPPKLYPGPTIQSRSAARRAAQDLVSIIATFYAARNILGLYCLRNIEDHHVAEGFTV